jgi:hypothetical protein
MWDQNLEPNVTAYRVFVGTSAGSYSETFDVPGSQTSFVYSSAARGRRYYVAVAAQVDNAVWGPRSSETSGTAASSSTPGESSRFSTSHAQALNGNLETGPTGNPLVTSASIDVVATGLAPVSAIAVSEAGVGLFVEGGHTVRAFDPQGIRAEPALTLEDDVQIRDIALDPAFDKTGRAYLAASRTHRERGREVTIERHRLVGGGLGEALAVVPGLEDHPASRTVLAVAHDGRLAVAQSGVVLAFTGDGRVPETLASPRLGDGPLEPASVAWDAAGQAVWLTGRNAAGATVERLGGSAPARNVMRLPAMLADAVPVAHVGTSGYVGIAGASVEAVMEFDPASGAATRMPVDLSRFGRPVHVVSKAGAWYVVLRATSDNGTTIDTVIRVAARQGASQPIN